MNSRKQLEMLVEGSYNELVSLLKWFSLFGSIPTIVGEWAVYFHNSYFGSIDIDIVGPSHQGRFIDLIERYQRTHGYEFMAKDAFGLEVTSRKPLIEKVKSWATWKSTPAHLKILNPAASTRIPTSNYHTH